MLLVSRSKSCHGSVVLSLTFHSIICTHIISLRAILGLRTRCCTTAPCLFSTTIRCYLTLLNLLQCCSTVYSMLTTFIRCCQIALSAFSTILCSLSVSSPVLSSMQSCNAWPLYSCKDTSGITWSPKRNQLSSFSAQLIALCYLLWMQ